MAKIFVLIGKSASGKNAIYRRLLQDKALDLKAVVPYTTRPRRDGEAQGQDYWFVTEDQMKNMAAEGKLIEHRVYQTSCGEWHYFTADDGQIDLQQEGDYLLIATIDGYLGLVDYFGHGNVVPLYVEVDDRTRLARALDREQAQTEPNYEEVCRRFLADAKDFAKERLLEAGITVHHQNRDLDSCLAAIKRDVVGHQYSGGGHNIDIDARVLERCRVYTMNRLKDDYKGKWVVLRDCLFEKDNSFISGKVVMSAEYRIECELSGSVAEADCVMYIVDPLDLGNRYTWEELADKFAGADVLYKDEQEVKTANGYTVEVTLVDVLGGGRKVKAEDGVECRNLPIFGMTGGLR